MFTLSIETNAGTYVHGFHLGTIGFVAVDIAEQIFHSYDVSAATLAPAGAEYIVTVALIEDGRLYDVYDGKWSSDE